MNSSTRLYERLGQIPQDPSDPECLEDLIVCAFGAFERYYVCWKNRGGEYRQDGYDLPEALREWLFPEDGSTRDFESLQVVFGRGDEYFASDKNGKLEYKEPEVKKPPESEPDKPAPLRRARTVSFLRPLSDPAANSPVPVDSPSPSRRSSASSQAASRPPSTLFSRPNSDASSFSQPLSRPPSLSLSRTASESSFATQPTSRPSSTSSTGLWKPTLDIEPRSVDLALEVLPKEPIESTPSSAWGRLTRRSRPLSMTFNPASFPKIEEGRQLSSGSNSPTKDVTHCTCGCHDYPVKSKSSYADAGVQTSPSLSPPRTALRIDTHTTSSFPPFSNDSSAVEIQTPLEEEIISIPNPVFMGRMLDYFSKPGYQLGDGLVSSYYYYQQPLYQYQEDFVEVPWDQADVGSQPG